MTYDAENLHKTQADEKKIALNLCALYSVDLAARICVV